MRGGLKRLRPAGETLFSRIPKNPNNSSSTSVDRNILNFSAQEKERQTNMSFLYDPERWITRLVDR